MFRTVLRLAKPVLRAADTASDVFLSPLKFGRQLREQRIGGAGLLRAGRFFLGSVAFALALGGISFHLLHIGGIDQISYWAFHIALVGSIGVTAALLVRVVTKASISTVLAGAGYAYGSGFVLGSAIVAGAAATIALLHAVQFIPPFLRDASVWVDRDLWVAAALVEYYECLRQNSIYNTLYNGMGGQFEALRKPIDGLSYVQPTAHLLASLAFVIVVGASAPKRRMLAGTFALASVVTIGAILLVGLFYFADYLHTSSGCSQKSIQVSLNRSAEAQVAEMVDRWKRKEGDEKDGLKLANARQDDKALVLTFEADASKVALPNFDRFVANFRRDRESDYCTSTSGLYQQERGISEVWIFRYGETTLERRVILNKDLCR